MKRSRATPKSRSRAGTPQRTKGTRGTPGADKAAHRRGLRDLINVGPATERDLRLLGITRVGHLVKQDPLRMYERLCRRTGQRHDPCCIDVFMAVVASARGEGDRAWWTYTPARKAMLARLARRSGAGKRPRA